MTAEQLEELLAEAKECVAYLSVRQDFVVHLISRVIVAEKLVEAWFDDDIDLEEFGEMVTAYREASK